MFSVFVDRNYLVAEIAVTMLVVLSSVLLPVTSVTSFLFYQLTRLRMV